MPGDGETPQDTPRGILGCGNKIRLGITVAKAGVILAMRLLSFVVS
jgi:hypothetical protein